MRTISIRIHTNASDIEAIDKVLKVIANGLLSKTNKHGNQYCFATSFTDGSVVECTKSSKGITFSLYP
jgi:hypothetical protein